MPTTLIELQKSIEVQIHNSEWFNKGLEKDLAHAIIGLTGESGEVAELAKKEIFRDKLKTEQQWMSELGDVLWYLTAVASIKGICLQQVWNYNCDKLEERREKGEKNGEAWEG